MLKEGRKSGYSYCPNAMLSFRFIALFWHLNFNGYPWLQNNYIYLSTGYLVTKWFSWKFSLSLFLHMLYLNDPLLMKVIFIMVTRFFFYSLKRIFLVFWWDHWYTWKFEFWKQTATNKIYFNEILKLYLEYIDVLMLWNALSISLFNTLFSSKDIG